MGTIFSKCLERGEDDKFDEKNLSQKQNRNQQLINNQMDNKGGLAVYSQIIDVNDNSVIRYEKNKENQNENNLKKISLKNDNLLETKSKELNKREKELNQRERNISPKELYINQKEADLNQREKDLLPKEEKLDKRENELNQRENGLTSKEDDLNNKEKSLIPKENDLKIKLKK